MLDTLLLETLPILYKEYFYTCHILVTLGDNDDDDDNGNHDDDNDEDDDDHNQQSRRRRRRRRRQRNLTVSTSFYLFCWII